MHVFRHDYIAHDNKVIATADPLQDLEKQIAISPAAEQWTALVTTRGDEM
jgi:hypothetical protein